MNDETNRRRRRHLSNEFKRLGYSKVARNIADGTVPKWEVWVKQISFDFSHVVHVTDFSSKERRRIVEQIRELNAALEDQKAPFMH